MPWKELNVMKLKEEFVLRALNGSEPFVDLCREFAISPKTGYKWKERFLSNGLSGLGDRSRRPNSSPTGLSEEVVCEIVRIKQAHRSWGPRKIRDVYVRKHPEGCAPSDSSFKRVLEKAGLVEKRRRRSSPEAGRLACPTSASEPNDLWTVDFKGWWYTPERERCEPLTVRDQFSRYVLCAQALEDARAQTVRREFERLFGRYGLPRTIRSDNGAPFAHVRAPLGLSRLSAWWVALGIDLDRIAPGRPEQNGAHERMHRDIAREGERINHGDLRTQAAALETWRKTYNHERPHEALGGRVPGDLYRRSSRFYKGTPDRLIYPAGYLDRAVQRSGTIGVEGKLIGISTALAGWNVGLKPDGNDVFLVCFGRLWLGRIDLATESFQPVCGLTTLEGKGLWK
jgi:putative transposase